MSRKIGQVRPVIESSTLPMLIASVLPSICAVTLTPLTCCVLFGGQGVQHGLARRTEHGRRETTDDEQRGEDEPIALDVRSKRQPCG